MAGTTYVPIASTTLGANATSISFSSIPQTYTDLVVIANLTRNITGGNGGRTVNIQINSDASGSYSGTYLSGAAIITTGFSTNTTSMGIMTSGDANYGPQHNILQFANYSNATTYKTVLSRYGQVNVSTVAAVGLWRSTAAITSLNFFETVDGFKIGDSITLYGILAA